LNCLLLKTKRISLRKPARNKGVKRLTPSTIVQVSRNVLFFNCVTSNNLCYKKDEFLDFI
jgi:hypothetical protein